MKKALLFLILAALLGGALALWLATRHSELDRYPAEQVATAEEFIDLQQELEAILANTRLPDAEKAAAIEALRPRMEAVTPGIHQMSTHRFLDLRNLLHGEDYKLPAIDAAMASYYGRKGEPTAADKAAVALMNIPASVPDGLSPADVAAGLLRDVAALEELLQREGLSAEEHEEALLLYQEKLLAHYISLWRGEDEGEAFSREVERLLAETPGAVERLEAHSQLLPPTNWTQEEDPTDLSVAQDAYARALRRVLIDSLPELMPAGRQELAQLADFLRETPQGTRCYLGSIWYGTRENGVELTLDLIPETRPSLPQRLPRRSIRFIPQGDAAEQERLGDRLVERGCCLLRCKADELSFTPEGNGQLSTRITEADVSPVGCVWRTLHRIFEQQPELREQVVDGTRAEVQP